MKRALEVLVVALLCAPVVFGAAFVLEAVAPPALDWWWTPTAQVLATFGIAVAVVHEAPGAATAVWRRAKTEFAARRIAVSSTDSEEGGDERR